MKFVEAARDLTAASNLEEDDYASICNEEYYEKIKEYYLEMDIKFWKHLMVFIFCLNQVT